MHSSEPPSRRPRGRRTAAVLVLAVLAALLPAASASAWTVDILRISGEEKVGRAATYSYTCRPDPWHSPGSGATWQLLRGGFASDVVRSGDVDLTVHEPSLREGSIEIDFAGLTPGFYRLQTKCLIGDGHMPGAITVNLAAEDFATTTSLTVSPNETLPNTTVDLRAHIVPAVTDGRVEFFIDGVSVGTAVATPNGFATLKHVATSDATVTARFVGAPGFGASSSAPVTLDVIDAVTAPTSVGIDELVAVGAQVSVTDLGTWRPTVDQGTELAISWQLNGQTVATGPTFTPEPKHTGGRLVAVVEGTHPALPGSRATATSPEVRISVGTMPEGDMTIAGMVDGAPSPSEPLHVVATGWPPHAGFLYFWSVDGAVVSIAPAYLPSTADLGMRLSVEVVAQESGYADVRRVLDLPATTAPPAVAVTTDRIEVGSPVVVDVFGPPGAPVPTGTVTVTLTPADAGTQAPATQPAPAVLDAQGRATVALSGPTAGHYEIDVAFTSGASPYRDTTTTGTLEVLRVAPEITVPDAVDVRVAGQGVLVLPVTGTHRPTEYVLLDGEVELGRGPVPADGDLEVTLPVLSAGTHDLSLWFAPTATTEARTVGFQVTVDGEPVRGSDVATAQVTSSGLVDRAGATTEITASGFAPGETVAVFLHPGDVLLGTAVADADGVARLTLTLPEVLETGHYDLQVTGGTSGTWGSLTVQIATFHPPVDPPVNPPVDPPGDEGETPEEESGDTPGERPRDTPTGGDDTTGADTETETGDTARDSGSTKANTKDRTATENTSRSTERTTQALATTGAEPTSMLVAAWVLILLGAAGVLIARRTRSVR